MGGQDGAKVGERRFQNRTAPASWLLAMSAHDRLFTAARRFCDDFSNKRSVLAHFSTSQCEVIEHGLPQFAPFLGRPFQGLEGVRHYISALAALITYENMHFSEYVVDPDARKVSVKGTATFTWSAPRESWDETFAYVLDFDHHEKITRYQIWGDTAALYLASQGRLGEVSGNEVGTEPR